VAAGRVCLALDVGERGLVVPAVEVQRPACPLRPARTALPAAADLNSNKPRSKEQQKRACKEGGKGTFKKSSSYGLA